MPAPTPPGATSPSIMLTSTVPPPIGVSESCAALTAPVDVPVVATANRARGPLTEPGLLALHRGTGRLGGRRAGADLGPVVTASETANSTPIAPSTARPWRRLPSIVPRVRVRRTGISRIRKISSRLVKPLGFSNGCAELALKNPPPLLPSSLIASWLATGPPVSDLAVPGQRVPSWCR